MPMTASIRAIALGFDNVYLVKDERAILVDGGEPGHFSHVAPGLHAAGVTAADIGLIVATHGHWDHIGCLAEIKQATGAPLAMHAADRACIESPRPVMPPGVTRWGRMLSALLTATVIPRLKIPPATVDVVVPDAGLPLEPYGIHGRILHTPGHTPGSISILLDSGDAFVGDLAMNRFPLRIGPGLPVFAEDMAQLKRSIAKLLAAGAKTIHPAHGKAFDAGVLRAAIATA
jgi:glyoxylase-like metal-dependent hydrolase (beta-lactamase superfamily II)